MGVSKNRGTYPKMDGLSWKTLLKWMIWGCHYFWKPPYTTCHIWKGILDSHGPSKHQPQRNTLSSPSHLQQGQVASCRPSPRDVNGVNGGIL